MRSKLGAVALAIAAAGCATAPDATLPAEEPPAPPLAAESVAPPPPPPPPPPPLPLLDASGNREAIPLVRIPPDYPVGALGAGMEGRCDLHFDILADGAVDPDTIVALCTDPTFVEPATRAVARWRYSPRIVDGQAVDRPGVQSSLTFSIPDE